MTQPKLSREAIRKVAIIETRTEGGRLYVGARWTRYKGEALPPPDSSPASANVAIEDAVNELVANAQKALDELMTMVAS